jgi:hypothetical protein
MQQKGEGELVTVYKMISGVEQLVGSARDGHLLNDPVLSTVVISAGKGTVKSGKLSTEMLGAFMLI